MKVFELKKDKNFRMLDIIDISERMKYLSDLFYKKLAIDMYKALKKEIDAGKFGTMYEFYSPVLCYDGEDYSIGFVINEVKKQVYINKMRNDKLAELKAELDKKYFELKKQDYNKYVALYNKELNYNLNKFDEEMEKRFSSNSIQKDAINLEFGIGQRRRRFYLNAYNKVMRSDIFRDIKKDIHNILFDYFMKQSLDKVRLHRVDDVIKRSFDEFCKHIIGD